MDPDDDLGNDEALVCLGQASGRVSVVHLPSWRLVMDVHWGPDGPLAPVQGVTVRHATLLTLHRDGAWLAWRDLAALAHKTAEPSSLPMTWNCSGSSPRESKAAMIE